MDEKKLQLKLVNRLIILIGFIRDNPTISDPLEYLYNQLLGWEKNIKEELDKG